MTRLFGKIDKGWGHELIWATNDSYCGKLLNFNSGSKCSMHFHAIKDETWYVLSGKFIVKYLDTSNSVEQSTELNPGDIWHNRPLLPHQLICLEAGTIIEVSSADNITDNHRIAPGDSQQ